MYRIASTIGYKNVSITFSIDPYSTFSEDGDWCYLSFTTDNNTQNWTTFAQYDSDDHIRNNTITLPFNTWNNYAVGIQVLAYEQFAYPHTPTCCYISDFYLHGIPINNQTTNPLLIFSSNDTKTGIIYNYVLLQFEIYIKLNM